MNRRTMIAGLAAAAAGAAPAAAAAKPYRVALVGDAFDGTSWLTGVRVSLDDAWKTYWRMPGEAGIPPLFGWKPEPEGATIEVRYPVPHRHRDASGEAVGYAHEVVFPVIVTPAAASSVSLGLDLFFAVCKNICIPAQAAAGIRLGTAITDPAGSRLVRDWLAKVPRPANVVSRAAIVETATGQPALALDLSEAVDDIFVETQTTAYFGAPLFAAGGRSARLPVSNVSHPQQLAGTALRLTFRQGEAGLEQNVTLP